MTPPSRRIGDAIVLQREGAIARVVLDAPKVRNALTQVQMLELLTLLEALGADGTVRVVALAGVGDHFCGGGAIDSFGRRPEGEEALSEAERRERRIERLERCAAIATTLRTMPKPTVALVRGAAAGAGMIYALACDLCAASDTAVFTTAYSKLALSGDMGAALLLTRIAGPRAARQLLLLADKLDAAAMRDLGMLSAVWPDASFAAEADDLLARLAAGPPLAYAAIKENLQAAEDLTPAQAIRIEAANMVRTLESTDCREARDARSAKRPPQFLPYPKDR